MCRSEFAGITGTVDLINDDPAPTRECAVVVDHVADLFEQHPELAHIYAAGGTQRPELVSEEDAEACSGDFNNLVRDLAIRSADRGG